MKRQLTFVIAHLTTYHITSLVKKAYKSLALKTHPDRVPPEERAQAAAAFQTLSAAYEVLSNDRLRRDYDQTGRVPNNPSMNGPGSSSSRRHGQEGFFNPFGHSTGFGTDSLFNDHGQFASSSRFDSWDPFANDPFLNPRARRGAGGMNGFGQGSFFNNMDDMLRGFPATPHPSLFDSMLGGRGFGSHFAPFPSPFQSFAEQMDQHQRAMNDQSMRNNSGHTGIQGSVQGSYSFFSSSSSSTFRDGKWTSVSHEESNINGERKRQSQRTWTDDDGVVHTERTLADGSKRFLRDGAQHHSGVLGPPPDNTEGSSRHSSRSSHRHDRS
ncbi:DnaJ-domain-containing protein [Serendipita vermifera]|nr:DnaJ-domain-containing protein [Serendipita vermifera]